MPVSNGQRLTGFPRYCELLERDFKRFFCVNALTLIGAIPFVLGVLLAVLSSSILLLIPACIIGGAIFGPALTCMYDAIFRSLRDAPDKWFQNYKRALKQNWKVSILPGIVFCLLLGFYTFMFIMFWWANNFPSMGTIAISLFGLLIITMFFSIYWPQVVLFEQSNLVRFKNCLLFILQFFWKTLGCSVLQILYWAIIVLFLPWSIILLPLIGLWFILFVTNFLLYDTMNDVFGIEEQIAEAFPEQVAFYEDDEAWLKRKQEEENELQK